jgi:hypothetical protein
VLTDQTRANHSHMQESESVVPLRARMCSYSRKLERSANDNKNESGTPSYLSFQRKFVPNEFNHLAESLPSLAFSC